MLCVCCLRSSTLSTEFTALSYMGMAIMADSRLCTTHIRTHTKDNEQMEERFGARWTRTPSHALTAQLREEANKYVHVVRVLQILVVIVMNCFCGDTMCVSNRFRANVEHARKSDAYIQRKFEGEEALLRKMSGGDAEIQSLLPRYVRAQHVV